MEFDVVICVYSTLPFLRQQLITMNLALLTSLCKWRRVQEAQLIAGISIGLTKFRKYRKLMGI